jgi:hypothetical protein
VKQTKSLRSGFREVETGAEFVITHDSPPVARLALLAAGVF